MKSLTENQATAHVKATTTPKAHQQGTAIQTELIPKTCPSDKITPQNSKSLPNVDVRKSGDNLSLRKN